MTAERLHEARKVSLKDLACGAERTLENAEQLYREAQLLTAARAVARALLLHQISLEECSKVDTLGAWAVSQLMGFAVDQKKLFAALSRHAAKNKGNAYMLALTEEEIEARSRGDWGAAGQAFRRSQDEFHARSNRDKNAALYVDWGADGFETPSERITQEMVSEIAKRNAEFLGYAHNNVNTLRRIEAEPDALRKLLAGFIERAETLREEQPDHLADALDALLSDFLADGVAQRQSSPPEK